MYGLLKPLLFSLNPETAHNLALFAIRNGLVSVSVPDKPVTKFGVKFPNPIGLAAGFDKNGVALEHWHKLGFGFVEIGTVTQHPQPGNAKPRLFRLRRDMALINRMGFNNRGADAIARTLDISDPAIPVGINIGKSKITALRDAHIDYAYSFKLLRQFASYTVVNVSSPNTPGLRSLQSFDMLLVILDTLKSMDSNHPLFVKVSPDLDQAQLEDIVELIVTYDLMGLVANNTTVSRSGLAVDPHIDGGLSGSPLTHRSQQVADTARKLLPDDKFLIATGGVMSANDVKARLDCGADLVQVYTGWVYNGPQFVKDICEAI
ncbi:MAG: quinone-dependent dihydroorotate dehydrogenase [Chthonomonadaceae bacterium]|nr:quinone-dependent dihydroorotate dehydrogenase [Chthonomonadaceae bacterium]